MEHVFTGTGVAVSGTQSRVRACSVGLFGLGSGGQVERDALTAVISGRRFQFPVAFGNVDYGYIFAHGFTYLVFVLFVARVFLFRAILLYTWVVFIVIGYNVPYVIT